MTSARFNPKLLVATDIVEGARVYLDRSGAWTRRRDEALVIDDARMAGLHLLDAEARAHEVTGPHLADLDAARTA